MLADQVTGCPTLSLPAGFDADGLPVGVQLVGRHGGDVDLLRAAKALETATGWVAQQPPVVAAPCHRDGADLRTASPVHGERRRDRRPGRRLDVHRDRRRRRPPRRRPGRRPTATGWRSCATAGHDLIVAVLACWHAGAIAVPLHPPNPDPELRLRPRRQRRRGRSSPRPSTATRPTASPPAPGRRCRRRRPRPRAPLVAGARPPGPDDLHERHDRPAEGRRAHPRALAAMVDGMVAAWAWTAGRPHRAGAAAQPRPRARQRDAHGARRRGGVRGTGRVRRQRTCGSAWRRARSRCSWPSRPSTPVWWRRGRPPTARPAGGGRRARPAFG